MRYLVDVANGDAETALFGPERGCEEFDQRILRLDGAGGERLDPGNDEVLFVLGGSATATVAGDEVALTEGSALYIARGTAWRVEDARDLTVLSVVVHDPLPSGVTHAVLDVDAQEDDTATAGRQFRLLATPDVGCESVTQFVGYIPVGRAPDHYHPYDEVVYVLEGNGALHVGGESRAVSPGSAVHLPARLVHCVENVGPGEMRVLGVFRPAGSPAEAYYPDGTRAQY
jgi:mannose-6-phosphate isomerase-like protein (cupin superfamily)